MNQKLCRGTLLQRGEGAVIERGTPNRRRFIQACTRFQISFRLYDGPPARTRKGTYLPTYYLDTNGMTCIIEVEGVWSSPVTIAEASRQLPNFYIMTSRNLEMVEKGHFRFVPLQTDLTRASRVEELAGRYLGIEDELYAPEMWEIIQRSFLDSVAE